MSQPPNPVEEMEGWQLTLPCDGAVAVPALQSQLPPLVWAFAQAAPGARLGYVQSATAPGGRDGALVRELRERGLLAGHVAVGSGGANPGTNSGADAQALTIVGALYHGLRALGWDAAVCVPGAPAGEALGLHSGGLAGLDAAHAALALGAPTLLVPRMSCAGRGERHRGISHDTLTVLDLLLAPVTVALPAGLRSPVGAELHAGLGAVFGAPRRARPQLELDVERPARIARHDWHRAPIDLPAFAASGLAAWVDGPALAADPLFYGAALAAGTVLAELALAGRAEAEERERAGRERGARAAESGAAA
ncbi:MAG TPA: DUF3866 family protein [Solirubrobacteraceae bacterium]|nr:DUF3866 family protein [Solirubrobacteraceae bacterium]